MMLKKIVEKKIETLQKIRQETEGTTVLYKVAGERLDYWMNELCSIERREANEYIDKELEGISEEKDRVKSYIAGIIRAGYMGEPTDDDTLEFYYKDLITMLTR